MRGVPAHIAGGGGGGESVGIAECFLDGVVGKGDFGSDFLLWRVAWHVELRVRWDITRNRMSEF